MVIQQLVWVPWQEFGVSALVVLVAQSQNSEPNWELKHQERLSVRWQEQPVWSPREAHRESRELRKVVERLGVDTYRNLVAKHANMWLDIRSSLARRCSDNRGSELSIPLHHSEGNRSTATTGTSNARESNFSSRSGSPRFPAPWLPAASPTSCLLFFVGNEGP
jgi:hypothetical protein